MAKSNRDNNGAKVTGNPPQASVPGMPAKPLGDPPKETKPAAKEKPSPKPTGVRIRILANCALGSGTRKPGDVIGVCYMNEDSSYAELVNALNNPQLIRLEAE